MDPILAMLIGAAAIVIPPGLVLFQLGIWQAAKLTESTSPGGLIAVYLLNTLLVCSAGASTVFLVAAIADYQPAIPPFLCLWALHLAALSVGTLVTTKYAKRHRLAFPKPLTTH